MLEQAILVNVGIETGSDLSFSEVFATKHQKILDHYSSCPSGDDSWCKLKAYQQVFRQSNWSGYAHLRPSNDELRGLAEKIISKEAEENNTIVLHNLIRTLDRRDFDKSRNLVRLHVLLGKRLKMVTV